MVPHRTVTGVFALGKNPVLPPMPSRYINNIRYTWRARAKRVHICAACAWSTYAQRVRGAHMRVVCTHVMRGEQEGTKKRKSRLATFFRMIIDNELTNHSFVCFSVHQVIKFSSICYRNLNNPSCAVWVIIY